MYTPYYTMFYILLLLEAPRMPSPATPAPPLPAPNPASAPLSLPELPPSAIVGTLHVYRHLSYGGEGKTRQHSTEADAPRKPPPRPTPPPSPPKPCAIVGVPLDYRSLSPGALAKQEEFGGAALWTPEGSRSTRKNERNPKGAAKGPTDAKPGRTQDRRMFRRTGDSRLKGATKGPMAEMPSRTQDLQFTALSGSRRNCPDVVRRPQAHGGRWRFWRHCPDVVRRPQAHGHGGR